MWQVWIKEKLIVRSVWKGLKMTNKKSIAKSYDVSISFSNKKAAKGFMEWLCDIGEQDYWESQKYREEDEDTKDITALIFDYNFNKLTVKTECGRLDDDRRRNRL